MGRGGRPALLARLVSDEFPSMDMVRGNLNLYRGIVYSVVDADEGKHQ